MSAARVGATVLAYGGGGEHGPLLESLIGQGLPAEDIVVVHNPARPGEPPPTVPDGCALIQTERNLGYAAGMNRGIAWLRRHRAELLLVLTHDARLRDGALERLIDAAERRPDFGVLGPVLVLAGTDAPFSFGGISRANGTTAHLRRRPDADGGVAACDWLDGGTMLIRAEAVAAVGGFDERFWGYCEEADLCLRVRRSGLRVGIVLDALAEQDPGGPKRPGAWTYLLTRNGAEYARRAAGPYGALTLEARAVALIALNLARVLLRTVRHRPGGPREPWVLAVATARGALDFLRRRWGPPPPDLPGMGDLHNA